MSEDGRQRSVRFQTPDARFRRFNGHDANVSFLPIGSIGSTEQQAVLLEKYLNLQTRTSKRPKPANLSV